MPKEGWGPRLPSRGSSGLHCCASDGVHGTFNFSAAPLISPPVPTWGLARLPSCDTAAILWRGRRFAQPWGPCGGRRARCQSGVGLATGHVLPPGAKAGKSPLFFFWAQGRAWALPQPSLDTGQVHAVCEPLKRTERHAWSPKSFLLSKPLKSGISHAHPCSVIGIDFMRLCSELERGKL